MNDSQQRLNALERAVKTLVEDMQPRVVRIETRLSKLMEHVGLKADGTIALKDMKK